MRKLRLKPPANDTRPTRRSLVELTAAARRAVDEGLLVMPSSLVVISADVPPRPADVAPAPVETATPEQALAPRITEAADPSPRPAALPDSESAAGMLVKIAKDHQARALEGLRLGFGAALDYAKDLAKTPEAADQGSPADGARADDKRLATAGAADAYRAETVEFVKANLATTLDYARDLAGTTTSAEFVALSSALARKQCEFMLRQAAALQSFARAVTKSDSK
jgi:hypothetical protein